MKILMVISVLIASSINVLGQLNKKTVSEIQNKTEVALLGTIDTFFIKRADRMFLRFFVKEAGKIEVRETHGTIYNVLIAVSEYGENEPTRVFSVGSFVGPVLKNDGTDLRDKYKITVEHGFADNRKKTKLIIYLDKVIVE